MKSRVGRLAPFVAVFLLIGFTFAATAQEVTEPPLPVEVLLSASGVPAGGEITLAAVFDVPENHHITDISYGLFFVEGRWPEGVTVTDTLWPKGDSLNGEEVFRGAAVIRQTIRVDKSVAPGEYKVPYSYSYQICRDLTPEICFLPNGGEGVLTLNVLPAGSTPIPSSHWAFQGAGAGAEAAAAATVGGTQLEDRLSAALQRGSLAAFLFVFLAGILVSFTPCVYPMIPIIIGFVGSSAGANRAKGFMLSLFFVLGLALTYATLGVIAGATGALFGSFLQNTVVLIVIIVVFVALGISMLGAFDITFPASVQGKLMQGARGGLIGAVFMGGVTGVIAAPCAGPPLLVLLGWIGNTGNLVLGFFLMATFALGIGVLFLVIGTFAGAMTALPQAGPWMDKIKKGLGVVIFAVALYYFSLLVSKGVFLTVLGGFLLLVGLFLGALARWEELSTAGRYGKGFGILLLLAGAFYFLLGFAELNHLALPSPGAGMVREGGAQAAEDEVAWRVNDYDAVMAEAAAAGKPVLIDFYADWCAVCVELDHKVWNQPEVIRASRAYIPLKLDFTRSTPELEALRKRYGVGGLPSVIILGPDGVERDRFSSFREPQDVAAWLRENAGS